MAALENLKNMHDMALKPRLLLTLLKDDVPDEKRPFDNVAELSRVVYMVETHKLLSESFTESMDKKLIERWKSAVDEWVNRLLSLVANSTMPDKCWAGICLLGVTCKECTSERFSASYALWFDKLLSHIQSPASSRLMNMASYTCISDLITRLAGFPNAKKEGTSLAGKLIQPLLNLLKDDASETVWDRAIHLLSTIITFFPVSLHRHYDSVEAAIVSNILLGKCSANMQKKFALCLTLLPKSRGDEDSWILIMRKILLLLNGYLTDIFYGLEEESKWDEAVRLLLPPGEVTPDSLWDQKLLESSDRARKRLKLSSISNLMLSCCTMLTSSYPVQVNVPVRSLLALVERVLMVDGSLPRSASPFVIAMEQDFICAELPVLHSHSLELLAAIIKGIRSQLLPHAAYTVRLVKEYFRRCELPELRIKVYSITSILLESMGVGMAIYLAQEVVNHSLTDLNSMSVDTSSGANTRAFSDAFLQPRNRKRKHVSTESPEQMHEKISLEVEAPKSHQRTMISVKIAALKALEKLLTVGGVLRSESWRSKIDNLLITIATDSFKWEQADLQLAALRALLASLLSPSHVRPPHLALGLELFRRGRQNIGTEVSAFCAHALLDLEILIHPRALPLTNFSSPTPFPSTVYSHGQNQSTPFPGGMREMRNGAPDSNDDLYESWINSGKGSDDSGDNLAKNVDTEKHSETIRIEKISVAGSSESKNPGRSEHEPGAANAEVERRGNGDEIMSKHGQFRESEVQLQEQISLKGAEDSAMISDGPDSTKMEFTGIASATGDKDMASAEAVTVSKGDGFATRIEESYVSPFTQKGKTAITYASDNDSSDDSMPPIVEAISDSD